MLSSHLFPRLATLLATAVALTQIVTAQSWIDCIDHSYDVVYTKSDAWVHGGSGGNGVCEGYAYNYAGRGDDDFETDFTWKLDADQLQTGDAPICQYRQGDADYNGWRHVVHAKAGDKLFLGYLPNGHVVKDEEGQSSTWGIYWSGQAGVELTKTSELTPERLVDGTLRAFDDGNCGANLVDETTPSGRAGEDKPCTGSFTIPTEAKAGRYQMVWSWTVASPVDDDGGAYGSESSTVAYTSCFDVVVDDVTPTTSQPTQKVHKHKRCDVAVEPGSESPAVASESRSPSTGKPGPQQPPSPAAADASTTGSGLALFAPADINPFSAPYATVSYNGIGGAGIYGKVTDMQCPSSNTCTQTDFAVSGPLAPFDEDLTLALRGPLHVDDIAVFTSPAVGSAWSRVSSFSKAQATSDNMVFLNNKGDSLKSGVFDMCNGNSQSYATADGATSASSATQFSGILGDGVEVNIMSNTNCETSGTCGVTRGIAQEGWKGNNKIFMVKATMPSAAGGTDTPAIWLLNGQVVRTAEYGCNCRGMGDQGTWKGGCGELDVAEVLPADVNYLTSTIYSFKGSRGTSAYALRPVDDAVVFVVILTEQTTTGSTNLGMAQVLIMNPDDVDMTTAPTSEQVDQWLQYRNGVQVDFDI